MLDSFVWPTPDGPPDEVLFRNVREHGCHIMGIGGDAQSTHYDFSIGLYLNYGYTALFDPKVDPEIYKTLPFEKDIRHLAPQLSANADRPPLQAAGR